MGCGSKQTAPVQPKMIAFGPYLQMTEDEPGTLGMLLAALFIAKIVLHLLTSRLFTQKAPSRGDIHFQELKRAYDQARPMIPEPNELKELSKSTGKTIEELNAWFRAMRAHERSMVVASRVSESVWRLALLGASCGLVLAVQMNLVPTVDSRQVQLVRSCVHLHLLALHLLSFKSMPIPEFLLVSFELLMRLTLTAMTEVRLSELMALTHDSVDAILELSKFLDLIGLFNVGKLVFLAFVVAWAGLKTYMFPLGLINMGFISPAVPLAEVAKKIGGDKVLLGTYLALMTQVMYDVSGFWTVLMVAKTAFWSRTVPSKRAARGDSLSSVTSLDYESDSSVSSALRMEPLKDD